MNEPARVVEMTDDQAPAEAAPIDPDLVDLPDDDSAASPRLPPGVARNADGSLTLKLAYPVTLRWRKGGSTSEDVFDTLVLHRLTGADRRVIATAKPDEVSVTAIARSARMPVARMLAIYDRMDAADASAAEDAVVFLSRSGATTGR